MTFWSAVQNNDRRTALEVAIPGTEEIPRLGSGQMDEFFWYLSHTEAGDTAAESVLMNLETEHRIWTTRMIRRESRWYVDVVATETIA